MKPYILNYSETINLSSNTSVLMHDVTKHTFTIETGDDDISLVNSTIVTESIENSDEEHCYEMSTLATNTIESSDDNIDLLSTIETRSLEETDEDFIYF